MKKELKYLNRKELIDIIYQLKKSEQELQDSNEDLKKKLEDKQICISESGSIAEAALALTGIFKTAQESADIYLGEIAQRKTDIENEYNRVIEEAQREADSIIRQAYKQRDAIVAEANKAYRLMKRYEAEIEKRKNELSMYNGQEK